MKEKKITELGKKLTTATLMALMVAGGVTVTGGTASASEPVQAATGTQVAPSGLFERLRCEFRGGRWLFGRICYTFRDNNERRRFDGDRNRHRGPDRDGWDRRWFDNDRPNWERDWDSRHRNDRRDGRDGRDNDRRDNDGDRNRQGNPFLGGNNDRPGGDRGADNNGRGER